MADELFTTPQKNIQWQYHFDLEENDHKIKAVTLGEFTKEFSLFVETYYEGLLGNHSNVDIYATTSKEGSFEQGILLVIPATIGGFFLLANTFLKYYLEGRRENSDATTIINIEMVEKLNLTIDEKNVLIDKIPHLNQPKLTRHQGKAFGALKKDSKIKKVSITQEEELVLEVERKDFGNFTQELESKDKISDWSGELRLLSSILDTDVAKNVKWYGRYEDENISFVMADKQFLSGIDKNYFTFDHETILKFKGRLVETTTIIEEDTTKIKKKYHMVKVILFNDKRVESYSKQLELF